MTFDPHGNVALIMDFIKRYISLLFKPDIIFYESEDLYPLFRLSPKQAQLFQYTIVHNPDLIYPVNILRNRGLQLVKTKLHLMVL